MKIKDEYKGKKVLSNNHLIGTILVDEINPKAYDFYNNLGLGYIFEKELSEESEPKAIKRGKK